MKHRGQWGSRLGFVLAAAGSAVGLGNLWKFPYVTGENGGGAFVLIYLAGVVLVGLPVMTAEVVLGRMTHRSPVGAFRKLAQRGSPWVGLGWLGVAAGFVILSYYSVVAGWGLHYVWLAVRGTFAGGEPQAVAAIFDEVHADPGINLAWHFVFMAATMAIVVGGIRGGVERAARVLMPGLIVLLLVLLAYGASLSGFDAALSFVFGMHTDRLTAAGVLEAVGHAFFTLSVGMGAMLTYGGYLSDEGSVMRSTIAIAVLDTGVALVACMVIFPITFSQGLPSAGGPGLVFQNMPVAFAGLPGGTVWATVFFVLLTFAALSSAISLLEVVTAYFIDERGWSRRPAVLLVGTVTAVLGIPSALSGAGGLFDDGIEAALGRNWFDTLDYLASNWMLPAGGLGIAVFAAWRVGDPERRAAWLGDDDTGRLTWVYVQWLWLLRWVVPVGIAVVMLHAIGVL